MFLPISPYVSSCFTLCFPNFFGYYPCFPWCFSLFPILGLTIVAFSQTRVWKEVRILRYLHNAVIAYTKFPKWCCRMSYLIKFLILFFDAFYIILFWDYSTFLLIIYKKTQNLFGSMLFTTCHWSIIEFLQYIFYVLRGGCSGLPLLPMQYPEMAHINFQSFCF